MPGRNQGSVFQVEVWAQSPDGRRSHCEVFGDDAADAYARVLSEAGLGEVWSRRTIMRYLVRQPPPVDRVWVHDGKWQDEHGVWRDGGCWMFSGFASAAGAGR
jgi:hypothetical protein